MDAMIHYFGRRLMAFACLAATSPVSASGVSRSAAPLLFSGPIVSRPAGVSIPGPLAGPASVAPIAVPAAVPASPVRMSLHLPGAFDCVRRSLVSTEKVEQASPEQAAAAGAEVEKAMTGVTAEQADVLITAAAATFGRGPAEAVASRQIAELRRLPGVRSADLKHPETDAPTVRFENVSAFAAALRAGWLPAKLDGGKRIEYFYLSGPTQREGGYRRKWIAAPLEGRKAPWYARRVADKGAPLKEMLALETLPGVISVRLIDEDSPRVQVRFAALADLRAALKAGLLPETLSNGAPAVYRITTPEKSSRKK